MTSLRNPHAYAVGDTVYDTRRKRRGVITTRPMPGRWIWLADPDRPGDLENGVWHTLLGDIRPAGPDTTGAERPV
ncbi:hypothetical protein [Streptomyces palmae]|uniref:Uncharacterized protein n=1 Tax=Streptomyces palmae TaxID=1701085 RepID=A0A4Z0GXN5_9ACTN|nr:hypothetical protein [Streptomyces palmae]TGB01363.1 hypothetical protein E4099_21110 [Streptomyces palmae]